MALDVPLDFTIDFILKHFYEDNEIQTSIEKKEINRYFFHVQKMYILVTMV